MSLACWKVQNNRHACWCVLDMCQSMLVFDTCLTLTLGHSMSVAALENLVVEELENFVLNVQERRKYFLGFTFFFRARRN